MRVVLATGIYPPEIGGPATYVRELSKALRAKGIDVKVVAYGHGAPGDAEDGVTRVSRNGGPIGRYVRYAKALREVAQGCDVVEAFSSVSVGIPLWLAHLQGPKKILRLGGDFLWERATDAGETKGLRQWYESPPRFMGVMNGLLRTFDVLAFSTEFQEELFRRVYANLPPTAVIENVSPAGSPALHKAHVPFRLLSLGRFVAFKNLVSLVEAMPSLPRCTLTFVGSGPVESSLRERVSALNLSSRVTFLPPAHGPEKATLFADHDLLVVPSTTDISPNAALEARAAGLPVLLTEETGLSRASLDGMVTAQLGSPERIAEAVQDCMVTYPTLAVRAAQPLPARDWHTLADEHISLFSSLL
jgi:glycosyltransferase involved in cell wall biosynthesis